MNVDTFSGAGTLVATAMPGSGTLGDSAALVVVLAHSAAPSSIAWSSLSFLAGGTILRARARQQLQSPLMPEQSSHLHKV